MDLYSARILPSARIAEVVSYEILLDRICEFILRAAFARAADEQEWEHEELRRKGLGALEVFHNGRSVWYDRLGFEACLDEETRAGASSRFKDSNELDSALLHRLDRDLRARWRLAGYLAPPLVSDMRELFEELDADAKHCAKEAQDAFLAGILCATSSRNTTEAVHDGDGPV